MVHRDLKPHNLMLTPDGRVKILDFGLARFAGEAVLGGVTGSGMVLGTVDYIAPEQADNAHEADIRSDIYSLGCTLYHLFAGQPPFPTGTALQRLMAHVNKKPQPLTELRDDLPEGLMSVLERMMAKNPRHRYQTPAEVASALEPFAVATAITRAPRPRPRAQATNLDRTVLLDNPPVRFRRRRLVAVATAIMFLVAGLLGVGVYRIATDKGELVITTESDDVKVVITRGGKLVDIIDTKTDKQIRLALRSGEYELELKGAPEGLKLNINRATLKRGETLLATITRETKVGEVRQFNGHTECVQGVAFFKDGRRFASCGWDRTLRVWDVATGKELARLERHDHNFDCLALCPDQRHVLSGGFDRTFRLWDLKTGKELHRFEGANRFASLAVSPDGRWVVSGNHDHTVRLWDLNDYKEVHRFDGHTWCVDAVAISSDSHRAASASYDGTVRLWDLDRRREIACLKGHTDSVYGVAFSPDGKRVLSGGRDKTLRLWDAEDGSQLQVFKGHTGVVGIVAFSPDGRRALSAGHDGTVRLWDVKTAKEIHCFTGHRGQVWCVSFSPDGNFALSCGVDRTIRLWRLPKPPAKEKR
jgi:WD40 repeat protein